MVCPVCQTKLADPTAKQCPQCDSDLDVFAMIGKHENLGPMFKANSVEPVTKSVGNNLYQTWAVWLLSLGFVGIALFFAFQMQHSILEELRQERLNRVAYEDRQAKITEKLLDKTTESYSSVATSFAQASREQRESIQMLNEKISNLEQQVLLEKMKSRTNKTAR